MTQYKKPSLAHHADLLVVGFLLLVYVLIAFPFGYFRNMDQLMFSTPDSQSYLGVERWILGARDAFNPIIRPILYPALLVIGLSVAGIHGIWGLQFIFWICTGLLLFRSIKTGTNNLYLAIGGLCLYAGNFTLLILTLHALTEVSVIFMLSVLVFVILKKPQINIKIYWPLILFIVSLLTITKPVFTSLWLVVLLYSLFIFSKLRSKQKNNWLILFYIFLASIPVLIQITIMMVNFNLFTISNIGSLTFNNYFLAQVYGTVNSVPLTQAREVTGMWGAGQAVEYVWQHFGASTLIYLKTIVGNFLSRSSFTDSPNPNLYLFVYMRVVNIFYFAFHVIMVVPTVTVLFRLYRKKQWLEFEQIVSLIVLMLLLVAASGITFWQGDRILLPSLPIWIVLYACVLSRYLRLRGGKNQVSFAEPS